MIEQQNLEPLFILHLEEEMFCLGPMKNSGRVFRASNNNLNFAWKRIQDPQLKNNAKSNLHIFGQNLSNVFHFPAILDKGEAGSK